MYCHKKADHYTVEKRGLKDYILPRDEQNRCFEIDHIIPYTESHNNSLNNLCTACWTCNSKKSNKKIDKRFPYFKATVDLEESL